MGNNAEMTSVSESGLEGRRVLVADEAARERWAYVGLLREAGARVIEARHGQEALALARAERPDLILAGSELPGIDGVALSDVLLAEPGLASIPVMLVRERGAPELANSSNRAADGVVSAFLAALRAQRDRGADPVERENLRAQSMVAMHRDPPNHVSHPANVVWRLRTSGLPNADGSVSGFGAELQAVSRILGAGLITLLLATVAVIGWRLAVSSAPNEAPLAPTGTVAEVEVEATRPASPTEPAADEVAPPAATRDGLTAFSGQLRPGVDLEIGASSGQGALVIDGAPDIRVTIDEVDRGPLPISVVLDEGRHVVRYRREGGATYRFYFVKSGATRSLRAITRPGGFVDAR